MAFYGCKKDDRDDRDRKFSLQPPDDYVVPEEHSLIDFFSPVMDQGATNTCTTHGVTEAIRYNLIDNDLPDLPLSIAQLYFDAGIIENDTSDSGRQIRDVVKSAAQTGVALDSLWSMDRLGLQPPPEVYADAATRKILEYQRVELNRQAINTAIYVGHPIIIGLEIFSAFESDEVAMTGIVPMPKFGETPIGLHCLLVGSYDTQYDTVLNSWGNRWFGLPSKKGYCQFPRGYLEKHGSDAWCIFYNPSFTA